MATVDGTLFQSRPPHNVFTEKDYEDTLPILKKAFERDVNNQVKTRKFKS